jgi:uncharacterized protein (DUF488 family)
MQGKPTLYTVGHSTRQLSELIALLREHGVSQLVDVRHFPRSRRNPQFNLENLEEALPPQGIAYQWMGEQLGGFRSGGYETYMKTQPFHDGIVRLEALAAERPTAIMCAEAVWFRCHRRFIGREMARRGYPVRHLMGVGKRVYEEPLPADSDST